MTTITMLKFLHKLNAGFDQIAEPKRFITFMVIMVPAIVAQAIALNIEYLPLFKASWAYLLFLLLVRVLYIHGWLKPRI